MKFKIEAAEVRSENFRECLHLVISAGGSHRAGVGFFLPEDFNGENFEEQYVKELAGFVIETMDKIKGAMALTDKVLEAVMEKGYDVE